MRYYVLVQNSNFGKVNVDGGGLVLKMWICLANISRNRKDFANGKN